MPASEGTGVIAGGPVRRYPPLSNTTSVMPAFKAFSATALPTTFAASLLDIPPDPYHVYGVRYKDEVIVRKEGKTGKK